MNKRLLSALSGWILLGVSMPMSAGQAHPNGPENRPFFERTIRINDKQQDCVLTFSCPKPDDIVDWTQNGSYSATDPHPIPLRLDYEYRGHFWQGVFGSLVVKVKVNARKSSSLPWKDLELLLEGIRFQRTMHNQAAKNNPSDNFQEWLDPSLSQLNGIPCVQQYVRWGKDLKGEWLYYFPISEDFALELSLQMVDNSGRPGLTQSDWRPRAEAFANRLLSTVRVHLEPKALQK